MTPDPRSPSPDLPPWLISLARQIARDCTTPGTYTITYTVPDHRRGRRTAVITRIETIRILEEKPR